MDTGYMDFAETIDKLRDYMNQRFSFLKKHIMRPRDKASHLEVKSTVREMDQRWSDFIEMFNKNQETSPQEEGVKPRCIILDDDD